MNSDRTRMAPRISIKKLQNLLYEYASENNLIDSYDDDEPYKVFEDAVGLLHDDDELKDDVDIYMYPENKSVQLGEFGGIWKDRKSLVGFHTLENGLTFIGCIAGADGELTLGFYIVYYDGERLRIYFPKEGTVYNKRWMCLFGSEYEMMLRKYKKEIPGQYFDKSQILKDHPEKADMVNKLFHGDMNYEEALDPIYKLYEDNDVDWDKIKADIVKNIKVI